jgi:hypothetical protein
MRPTTHCRLGRSEPDLGGVGFGDAWEQHGQKFVRCEAGFTPCGLGLGGPYSSRHRDADDTLREEEDYITGITSVTDAETTCGDLHLSHPLRCTPRQALDVPYNTMVSFTKDVEYSCKRYILTRVGKKSAHVCLAVLLLRESFHSVQRRWVLHMR